jgi:hypothetical protein
MKNKEITKKYHQFLKVSSSTITVLLRNKSYGSIIIKAEKKANNQIMFENIQIKKAKSELICHSELISMPIKPKINK